MIAPFLISLVLAFSLSVEDIKTPKYGTLEIVALLEVCPGNVAVSHEGRIFASVHPLRKGPVQLMEVLGDNQYEPFPSPSWNKRPGTGRNVIHSPLGVVVDDNNWLWVIDGGNVLMQAKQPKLLAFDVKTRKLMFRYDFPTRIAPVGSFLQDLVVDVKNQMVYLADVGGQGIEPAIVALNYGSNTAIRFEDSRMKAENIDLILNKKSQNFLGKPARVGVNPITLSANGERLFFGSLSGTKFYVIPAIMLRNFRAKEDLSKAIKVHGPKPLSDGSTIDANGNIYITNLQNNSLDVLRPNGVLQTIVKNDKILDWPDNARLGPDGWVYLAVNQLHKTKAFLGKDMGQPPYYIVKVYVGEQVVWGR